MDYFNVFSSLGSYVSSSPIASVDIDIGDSPFSKAPPERIPLDWESGGTGSSYCVIA
jgi:hypothetical protein